MIPLATGSVYRYGPMGKLAFHHAVRLHSMIYNLVHSCLLYPILFIGLVEGINEHWKGVVWFLANELWYLYFMDVGESPQLPHVFTYMTQVAASL